MELEELKSIWVQSDQQAEQEFRINFESLKKISLEKAKSSLFPLKLGAIIEIIVNAAFLPPVVRFLITHKPQLEFALPAFVLAILLLFTIVWNIYSLIFLATIHYRSSIIDTQKKLQTFNYRNTFRQQRLLYILYPIAQTCFLILFCKAVPGIDLYEFPIFLLFQFLIGIAIIPAIIWIIKLSPDKTMDAAISFLNDIKEFEKE